MIFGKDSPCTEQSNDLAPLLPFRYWLGCITNTFGYDFRKGQGDGYPRSTNLSSITVAEWLCGTSDRHIAPRVPGSSGHLRRDAPAANSFRLYGVLQSSAHALGITERCALASSSPTIWRHCRHSDLGWAAPPIHRSEEHTSEL